jgi:hypothetical protein
MKCLLLRRLARLAARIDREVRHRTNTGCPDAEKPLRNSPGPRVPRGGSRAAPPADPARHRGRTRSPPGVQRQFQSLLDGLNAAGLGHLPEALDRIRRASEGLETFIAAHGIGDPPLSRQTRDVRAWLAFFSRADHLEAYAAALSRARSGFRAPWRDGEPSFSVQFRPIKSLFRLQASGRALRLLVLPTPAITFDEAVFRDLAGLAGRQHRDRQSLLEAMAGEPYQTVRRKLEALAGFPETTGGACHDLDASFQRVNAAYFGRTLARPRLTWSRALTRRKFGHYDPIHDVVMVSRSLDAPSVPALAVDFIMYHELLHKFLGVRWRGGRSRVHTPEFRRLEGQFDGLQQALHVLAHSARSRRRGT